MEEPWWVLMLKVFGGPLLSGLVAAGITYWFSRRRFIGERWWDRKADAYGSIIGSLVGLVHLLDEHINDLDHEVYPYDERGVWVNQANYDEILAQLKRTVTEGDYVISRKAASALSELIVGLTTPRPDERIPDFSDPYDSWLEDRLGYDLELVGSCLEAIRAEAQSDLQVK